MTLLLLVPGWQNSGPQHWQSLWQASLPGARRAELPDWDLPRRGPWATALDAAIAACPEPPTIAAHSLGCIAVAHWAAAGARPVRAALLVAPPDVERPDLPEPLRDFAPAPRARLPFPSRVVVTGDDPYISAARARELAGAWGSAFTQLPEGGHLNTASGHGPWPEGERLLRELLAGA